MRTMMLRVVLSVLWLVFSCVGVWAADYSGTEYSNSSNPGANYTLSTGNKLTISPNTYTYRGTTSTVRKTGNYSCTWGGYGGSGTPVWRTARKNYKDDNINGTYNYCDAKTIVVSEGITEIGQASLARCFDATSIILPNSLTTIGREAFRHDASLTSIHLGPNVCTIGDRWATDCYSLEEITVDPDNNCYVVDEYGVLYTKDMTTLVKVPQNLNISELNIPEGVTKFATDALYQQKYLKSLVIPSSMKTIQYGALDGCPNLQTLWFRSETAPKFEKTIGNGTDASSITVYIPCTPENSFDKRKGQYGTETGINVDNINAYLNQYEIKAISPEPRKGSANVTSRMVGCEENNTATIVADPSLGYEFLYWQSEFGTKVYEKTYTYVCTRDESWYAYFSNGVFHVDVKANDPSVATTEGSGDYEVESNVTIKATATKDCYTFEKWDDENTENPRTFIMDAGSKTFTAIYSKNAFNVSASVNDAAMGSVTVYDQALSTNVTATDEVYCNDNIQMTAVPAEHYHFVNWDNDNEKNNEVLSFFVSADESHKAYFAADEFTIKFKNYDGTVLQSSEVVYDATPSYAGETPEKPATAEYTYTFSGWTPEVVAVEGDAEYVAVFTATPKSYKFIKVVDGGETVTSVAFGVSVEAPADPSDKEGYTFKGWKDGNGKEVVFPFDMPAKDTIVYSNYVVDTFNFVVENFDRTEELSNERYTYGSAITMPAAILAPVRVGYTFTGWSDTVTTMPAHDVTIFAVYEINNHKVVFRDSLDVAYSEAVNGDYGTAIVPVAGPTHEGYTFVNWKDEENNVVDFSTFTMPDNDVTVIASYKINQYKFIADVDGETTETIYDYQAAVTMPASPSKTGYTFTGWSDSISVMPANDVTTVAEWKINQYKFIADVDGKTTETIYDYQAAVTMPSSPSKTGYTFAGWSDSISVMPAKDVTTVAQWKVNQYKFIADVDGETTETIYDYQAAVTMPASPSKTGYTFAGWSDSISVMPANDVTTVAEWKINQYKFIADVDGETTETIYDYQAAVTMPASPSKTGYTFAGWSDSISVMPANDVTTVAEWKVNQYKFIADVDGETTETIYDYQAAVTMPASPSKTGYTFAGWSDSISVMPANDVTTVAEWKINQYKFIADVDGETTETIYDYQAAVTMPASPSKPGYTFIGWSDSISVMPAKDVTTVAQWEINQYTITFKYDADSVIKTETLDYNSNVVKPIDAEIKKEGYTFKGWDITVPDKVPVGGFTATAVFEINKYIITFVDYDGTELKKETLDFGAAIVAPSDPDNYEGHSFVAWSPALEATVPAKNMTFQAQYDVDSYTLTYLDWDDNVITSNSVNFGSKILRPANEPSRVGHSFDKWVYASDESEVVYSFNMPANDVTIKATYKINSYLIAFDVKGGEPVEAIRQNYDTEVTAPTTTREGYTFLGWYPAVPERMPDRDMVCSAEWKINQYTITFDTDGGTEIAPIKQEYNTDVTKPADPKKTGYTFVDWKTAVPAKMPAKDSTVKAVWEINQYKFIADVDGKTTETIYDYQAAVTMPSSPSKTGYTFAGWSDSISVMPAKDVTTVAEWKINQYKFIADVDGKTTETIYDYQAAVTMPSSPSKPGYTFAGWSDSISVMPAKDVTTVAEWKINQYKFIADVDGKTTETIYDYQAAVTMPSSPSKTGYTFAGWSDSISVMPAKDVTTVAEWKINQYKFIADVDGKTTETIYDYQAAVTMPSSPSKPGYTFAGWSDSISVMPANDVTTVAEWKINQYTITFDTDGGTEIAPIKQDYNTDVTKPADPTKTGYTFVDWKTGVPAKMPAKDSTVKAEWKINKYTVNFYTHDGVLIKSVNDDYKKIVIAPSDPKRDGYTFTGWDKTVPATIPAENVDLYATYDVNMYTITFKNYDDALMSTQKVAFGADTINVPANPERKGYTFKGWAESVPATMPSHDVICKAQFDINQYTITFRSEDSVRIGYSRGDFNTPVKVNIPTPSKEGHEFTGWDPEVPELFPDSDMSVYATFRVLDYVVKYNLYDTTLADTLNYGAELVRPQVEKREGYSFTGWSDNDSIVTMPAKNIAISANYKINQYTITYNDYNDTLIKAYSANYATKVPAFSYDKREGYTFTGWSADLETVPAKDTVLTAQYAINAYEIKFLDYDKKEISKATLEYNSDVVAPADPKREGYTFTGWSSTVPAKMPAKNVSLTAVYKINQYVLVFRDYDKSVVSKNSYDFGASVTAPADPERVGYTFIGWNKEVPSTMPAHNDTLQAVYEVNKYNLTFMDKETEEVYQSDSLDYDTKVVAPADPEKDGYTFDGWDIELPETMPDVNIIIYATWKENPYIMTYVDFDETILVQDTVLYGANVVAPADPKREGYTFTGWDPEVPATMPAFNDTLMAQYKVNKYVVVIKDGDSILFKDTLNYGDTLVVPDPEKDGYEFDGWEPSLPETVPAEDIVVTPIWKRSEFVLSFYDYDSTLLEQDSMLFEAKIKAPADPKREGYTFAGWDPKVPAKMPAENLDVYATYKINKYLIEFRDDNDSILFSDSLAYGDPIVAPEDPKKDGYTFEGWDPEIPATVPAEDIHVHPTWSEDSIVIITDSVKAISALFCAGEEAGVAYKLESGRALSFVITFDSEAVKAGFPESIEGDIDTAGVAYFTIPSKVEEGTYNATLTLKGETVESASADFKISTNVNSRYISRMWDDVVVCDNSDEEFDSYQWYKDGEKIEGANKQFYCELGGLDGNYSVMVTTKDGKKKFICGIQCDRILPPFSIVAYPNPAKANEEFTLEVKGLTEEELETAKIYVYTVSGTIAHTERKIDYKNMLSLPQGEYIGLVVVEGKSAFCKIIVR